MIVVEGSSFTPYDLSQVVTVLFHISLTFYLHLHADGVSEYPK